VKDAKEQYGQELGPKTPQEYAEYNELAPQRPTFGDRGTTSTGIKHPGHDRTWNDTPTSPQGDGQPGPRTPISGGKSNQPKGRRHSTVDSYVTGNFDPARGRVADEGKKFEVHSMPGDGKMFPNLGPQTPANKREIKIGWKNKGYDLGENAQAGAPMTAPNTPQRKKIRKTESR